MLDQALFALSSFAVSVLLARWLVPHDYGAFAVASSVLLLMGTVHTALLGEPMHVFGPSRHRGQTPAYVRRVVPLHFALTAGMSVVLLVVLAVLAVLHRPLSMSATLAALALSAPAILFLWLMRRACYIDARPRLAAFAGLVYALLVPAGLLPLTRAGDLTAASGLVVQGVASLLVGAGLQRQLTGRRSDRTAQVPLDEVTREHWSYGRWALGSGLLSWVPGNVVVLALPLWHTLGDAGLLRVATTLMLPMQNLQTALGALVLPALVRARISGRLRQTASTAGLLFLALSAVYAPVVVLFGSALTQLLFGAQYRVHGAVLWLLAVIPLMTAVSVVAGAVLRALERPDRVLWTYVAATAVTCLAGLPLVFLFGVDGALTALLLSSATTAITGLVAAGGLTARGAAAGPRVQVPERALEGYPARGEPAP